MISSQGQVERMEPLLTDGLDQLVVGSLAEEHQTVQGFDATVGTISVSAAQEEKEKG